MLPLLGGVIFSAVASGQVVARTGRYRWLLFASLVATAVGLVLMTQLRADTPLPLLWGAMLITGVGVGPMFAVFPLVVQNSVPVRQIGSAVSNLTFFQQVGGTVGLAITGTIFGSTLAREVPASLGSAGLPPEVAGGLASGGGGAQSLTGVRRHGRLDPGVAAGRCSRAGRAVHPDDRRRDPPGVLDRDGEHVRGRNRVEPRGRRAGTPLPRGAGDGGRPR
jgi:MFS family permease